MEFVVWRITRIIPGSETVERMIPTETLRQRLLEAGIPTEFDGHETFRSLIGKVPVGRSPDDLLRCMRKVCLESPVTDLGCAIRRPSYNQAGDPDAVRQCPRE